MNIKQWVIKQFLTRINRDTGDEMMSDHLAFRWNGPNNENYNRLWDKLDGNNDQFLFDDYCEIGFDLSQESNMSLACLFGDRLNNLFKFSLGMLLHYIWVSAISGIIGFGIKWIFRPFFYFIFLPVYTILSYLWLGWVIFANALVLFIGGILTGDIFR